MTFHCQFHSNSGYLWPKIVFQSKMKSRIRSFFLQIILLYLALNLLNSWWNMLIPPFHWLKLRRQNFQNTPKNNCLSMILINPKAKPSIHPNRDPLLRNRIKSLYSRYVLPYFLYFDVCSFSFFETIAWIWEMIN